MRALRFWRTLRYLMIPAMVMSTCAARAQTDPCEAIQYSQVVLKRSAGWADCVQVFISDGDYSAVLPANVIRIQKDHILLRVWPLGSDHWEIMALKMSPPFRVLIEGEPPPLEPVPTWESPYTEGDLSSVHMAMKPRTFLKSLRPALLQRDAASGFALSSALLLLLSAMLARIRWLPSLR